MNIDLSRDDLVKITTLLDFYQKQFECKSFDLKNDLIERLNHALLHFQEDEVEDRYDILIEEMASMHTRICCLEAIYEIERAARVKSLTYPLE